MTAGTSGITGNRSLRHRQRFELAGSDLSDQCDTRIEQHIDPSAKHG